MSSESENIRATLVRLKKVFLTGKTRTLEWRLHQLRQLKKMVSENEIPCKEALAKDLGRGDFESFALELLPTIFEIDHGLENLSKWMQPTFTSGKSSSGCYHYFSDIKLTVVLLVPGVMAPATAEIVYEPYGVALVISSFNYPIQLSLLPMIGAIMAGQWGFCKPLHTCASN
jgi:aldehyde dehydrogenase (NAD+)